MSDVEAGEAPLNDSFYSLTPDRMLDAVELIGQRCTGRSLALNSFENRVYEMELEGDEKTELVVAKFYRPGRWSREQIQEEHDFLLELERADIPVVAPLKFPDGSTLKVTNEGIFFAVFPKRGGRIRDEFSLEDLRRLGGLVARMHRIGALTSFEHRLTLSVESYGAQNLEFLKSTDLVPPHLSSGFFAAGENLVRICSDRGLIGNSIRAHGDLHIGNNLWRDERILLVDFDDSMTAPPLQDLWLLFGGEDPQKPARIEAVLEGYSEWLEFDRSSLASEHVLRSLRQIHFICWYAKRWKDPIFPRSFSFFGTDNYWMEQQEYFNLLARKILESAN